MKLPMFLKNIRSFTFNINLLRSFATSKTSTVFTDPDSSIEIENPYERTKKVCILCKYNISPSYKNVKLLSQFQSPYTGRIYGRHITGLCRRKQEVVEKAIIRAQNCALMPYYNKDIEFLTDPSLFDSDKPIRPHKY